MGPDAKAALPALAEAAKDDDTGVREAAFRAPRRHSVGAEGDKVKNEKP